MTDYFERNLKRALKAALAAKIMADHDAPPRREPFVSGFGSGFGRGFGADFGIDFGPDGPFGPAGPLGADGGGRGPRRRKRMFGQGELRLVLLHLVAQEPRHGYELIKALSEVTLGAYEPSPGTVYPTLALLEDEGLIEHVPGPDSRKPYQATDEGRIELEEKAGELETLMERLGERAGERKGKSFEATSPDVFRAAGNLAAVIRNKVREGRFEEDTREKIVDLIDDLARRIEKL